MKSKKLIHSAISAGLTVFLVSCAPTQPIPSGSTEVTVVAPITSFGSVFVNGVEYNTDTASVTMDGVKTSIQQLEPGMMVTLKGVNHPDGITGTATSVEFEDDIEGEVVSNNIMPGTTSGTIDVMGQTVTITDETVFDSNVPGVTKVEEIGPGMICEVSGYSSGTGKVTATFIEVEAADRTEYSKMVPEGMHLKGKVSNLNETAMTFTIGTQPVDYTNATMWGTTLANDSYVVVKSTTGIDANGVVPATYVGVLSSGGSWGYTGGENEWYATKGKITTGLAGGTFEVNGKTIQVGTGVEYYNITEKDLVVDTYVIVTGKFDANGVVVATKIAGFVTSNAYTLGTVTAVTSSGTNTGTVTIKMPFLNIETTYAINNDTVMMDGYKDDAGNYVQNTMFNLQSVKADDFVFIKYVRDSNVTNQVATALYKVNSTHYSGFTSN